MTQILILGGGGMIGQKLAQRIIDKNLFPNAQLTLFDRAFPINGVDAPRIVGDASHQATAQSLAAMRPDIIFHLAAVVSGQAEVNFDLGWDVNMMAMWHLLHALKVEHHASEGTYRPRFIFTSSIAVFGGPFPDKIDDDFLAAPQTSYGAQKATCELLVTDFSRKGFIDGVSLRLPTICVRPGKANAAASSFFSGIIREPLNGKEAILPVADSVRHWHASPRSATRFLTHAAQMDTELLMGRRALNMPGLSCTVEEQLSSLYIIGGISALSMIRRVCDASIMGIVSGWPRDFAPVRALSLGFRAEESFEEIISVYLTDDLR